MRQLLPVMANVIVLMFGGSTNGEHLQIDLSPMTLSAGGQASIPLIFDSKDLQFVKLNLEPEFSVFVHKGLALTAGLVVNAILYSNLADPWRDNSSTVRWGITAGLRYYFDVGGRFYPFVGVLGTPSIQGLNWAESFLLRVQVPVGCLIALNESVALEVGIPLSIYYSVRGNFYRFDVPIGYFGVRAFF